MNIESVWRCNTCSEFTNHSDIKKLDTPLSYNILFEGVCPKCKNRNVNTFLKDEPNPLFGKGIVEDLIPMQLKQAKEDLERLREEFKDEPDLLACYEPSALYLVELLESHIGGDIQIEIIDPTKLNGSIDMVTRMTRKEIKEKYGKDL